ncbi:MAG: hypothetical protein QW478_04985 [Candidatus Micrarchaeaceae archaeon]
MKEVVYTMKFDKEERKMLKLMADLDTMKLNKYDRKMLKFMANLLDTIMSYPDLHKDLSSEIKRLKRSLNFYLKKQNQEVDVKAFLKFLSNYTKELKKLRDKL